ncbi:hypothetical protein MKW94_009404, partial [Papaver nudicaule]|nr:hypothetical protein [Papaver nudicaule]
MIQHLCFSSLSKTDIKCMQQQMVHCSTQGYYNPNDLIFINPRTISKPTHNFTIQISDALWSTIPAARGVTPKANELEDYEIDDDWKDDSDLFLDGEAYDANPYRCLPRKAYGDPPVFSEEMDKILYPNLKH